MEGKFPGAQLTVYFVVFITGQLTYLTCVAASDDMFHLGSVYGGSLSYYGGFSEEPLSWRGQVRYCSSRNMMVASIRTAETNRLFHDQLHATFAANGIEIPERFWINGWTDDHYCQYAYYTTNWMGTTWADCHAEIMNVVICKKKS